MRRRARTVALAAGLAAAWGCAVVRAPDTSEAAQPAWPADEPRVRLERIVATPRDVGGGGPFAFLRRRANQPLFVRPYGVAWEDGALLVTDPGAGRVVRLPAGGGVEVSGAGGLSNPTGVAVCSFGIVVSDPVAGEVVELDRRLRTVRPLLRGLARPTGVACDEHGLVVVETAAHRLVLRAPDGSTSTFGRRGTGAGEFNYPTAVALAGHTLLVGDTLNFRVQRFDWPELRFRGSFGELGDAAGEMPRSKGMAVDVDGHLWLADAHLDQVALHGADGEFLLAIGAHGTAPGEFDFPAGIAANPDGRVAVVDSLNRRLEIFRLVGGGGARW